MRPRELQDALNFHLYHPLSWQLARRLALTPITPNMVSVAGAFFVVAAALAYAQPGWPLPALAGLLLHMTWHVVDGADGDLARLTGRSNPVGELVDGICDYASHIVLYLTLGYILQSQIGPLAWLLTILSGVSHIAQSNHYEVQRRQYQWWVYGVPWLGSIRSDDLAGRAELGKLRSGYLRLAETLGSAHVAQIENALRQAGDDPVRLEQIRGSVRRNMAGVLKRASVLSSNHRTIILGVTMLAGSPAWYFLYQAMVLNVALIFSVRRQAQAMQRIAAEIAQPARTLR